MPTVTDAAACAETRAESGYPFSSQRPVIGHDRLAELLALREQIDAEIARERACRRRLRTLGQRSQRVLAQPAWEDQVLAEVAAAYVVDVETLKGSSRAARVVEARHVAFWVLRQQGLSLPAIGRLMNRDHKTVLHGVRRVEGSQTLRAIAIDLHGRPAVGRLRAAA